MLGVYGEPEISRSAGARMATQSRALRKDYSTEQSVSVTQLRTSVRVPDTPVVTKQSWTAR